MTAAVVEVDDVDEAVVCSRLDVYCCSALTSPDRKFTPADDDVDWLPSPSPSESRLEPDVELALELEVELALDDPLVASCGPPPPW